MAHFDNRRQLWQISLVLGLLTFLVYLGVVGHDFVNFDDTIYVTDNSFIQNGITSSSLAWALTTDHAGNWHPLTWISHMLDFQLYGLQHPGGHHLTNVLFHIVNTLLLFFVLRRMTGATWRSALVAALFAWHPLHVESVAWLAERKDVLSTFFGLLTLWAYAGYASESNVQRPMSNVSYRLALLFFALGLMSKPMLVTLPFVLLLLDYWPLNRISDFGFRISDFKSTGAAASGQFAIRNPQSAILEKLPFFALAFISSIITFVVQRKGGAVIAMERLPFPMRLANALLGYIGYLRKMLWPSDLAVLYPFPNTIPVTHWLAAGAVLLAISAAVITLARKRPYLLVGWLWYVGTLVPVIGIVQVGTQSMADRYTYLPLVGIFIMLVWGLADWLQSPGRQKIGPVIAVPVLVACLVMTWIQQAYWKDSITLFRRALAVTRNNTVAHIDLGRAYDDAGQPAAAKAEFQAALGIEPQSAAALTSLGVHYAKQGDVTNALDYYHSALVNQPYFSDAHYNLGNVLAHEGKLNEAAAEYDEALRIKPDAPDAHNNLGAVLVAQGKLDEAAAQFAAALRLRPNYPEAQAQLGDVMLRKGRPELARIHYAEAVRLKPDFVHAQLKLGLVMAQQGDIQTAISHFQAAIQFEPQNAEGYYYLGTALAATDNAQLARQAFDQAIKLKPGDVQMQRHINETLAKLNAAKGQTNVDTSHKTPSQ